MSEVFNPYHFVPVSKRTPAQQAHDLTRENVGAGPATHERYVAETYSGRIVCRITTKTPLVAGGEQNRPDGDYACVKPYQAGDKRPAIPASALRGMISSLAEAASNSAARILEDRAYSFRKPFDPKYTLSAIGMIVKKDDGLGLLPLALPTLEKASDGGDFVVPQRFRKAFPEPLLKVYFGEKTAIRQENFSASSSAPAHVSQWTVRSLSYNVHGSISDDVCLHCKDKGRHNARYFLVAQKAEGGIPPRDGYLRVLGCWGDRTDHIPEGKKHELWLPKPKPGAPVLKIDQAAIARFHSLADERTEASLKAGDPVMPFHPLPTARNEDPKQHGQKFRLKEGDMVYFDITEDLVVKEISLAAIWRGQVTTKDGKAAGAHAFFSAVDPDLLPFNPTRTRITIAEQIFGFVEEADDAGLPAGRQALALASRVRFSDALLPDGVTRDQALETNEVPLRILASPKPPCPAMYFHPRSAPGWVAKTGLTTGTHIPNGRKMYLHHSVPEGKTPWRTAHETQSKNQKNKVRPIRRNQTFWFHIDYDNLTDAELGLLLYALAPADGFHHKLGMGKPLGLGSIQLEVMAIQEVDRAARYTLAGLRAGRHNRLRLTQNAIGAKWPVRYADASRGDQELALFTLRDRVIASGLISKAAHRAICLLGDFRGAPSTNLIHTPTLADQHDPESETYQWFVANDSGLKEPREEVPAGHQHLRPLDKQLPSLQRPEWRPRERR